MTSNTYYKYDVTLHVYKSLLALHTYCAAIICSVLSYSELIGGAGDINVPLLFITKLINVTSIESYMFILLIYAPTYPILELLRIY